MTNNENYQVVIGLEVHAQLLTKSKLFCGDSSSFGADPNTQVSPVSLAHPGTLPKLNESAIRLAVRLGLALHCEIERHNYFARKNYFYPDLPKGYQVSQHTAPVCKGGYLNIMSASGKKSVQLNRIHLEEDAGKSIHDLDENYTCIDLNRAGVPLLEIVTEPVMHSADEAFAFLTELRKIVRWLDVCDGNMEQGSLRCDANISIRKNGDSKLGKRVEIKNLNSIRNVKKAIESETLRMTGLAENGEEIIQETRSFDPDNNKTFSLRNKEEGDDYRYFPEPDLPPFFVEDEMIANLEASMPVLPEQLKEKYVEQYLLSDYDASIICNEKQDARLFEAIMEHTENYKGIANWVIGPIKSYCNEHNVAALNFPVKPGTIAALIDLTESRKINYQNASTHILQWLINNPETAPVEAATALNLLQENDNDLLEDWVTQVIAAMPEKKQEYKRGKKNLIGVFAGEVKKLSKGKADMQLVNKLLSEKLNS